jgi:hypothetical protein
MQKLSHPFATYGRVLVDGSQKSLRSMAINVGCYGDFLLYPNRCSRQQRFWSARNEDLSSGVHHSDEPDRISKRRHDVVVQSVQVVLCIGKKRLKRSEFRNHLADSGA